MIRLTNIFDSIDILIEEINKTGYIIDKQFANVLYIAYKLKKPLLISGPPGTGKSQIAVTLSKLINNVDPIRLQCYDGITADEAMYSFNYKKQLLYMEATKGTQNWQDISSDIYSEKFLSYRPLLKSIMSDKKEILLIDELDKTDEEFEAFLLEFLNDFQISIPEFGTVKAKKIPFVILTSNDMRELTDALRRRCCFYYIDYPDIEKELQIVHAAVPGLTDILATKAVAFIQKLRNADIKKAPSISETIDWVNILSQMKIVDIDAETIRSTINVILKYQEDINSINSNLDTLVDDLPTRALKVNKIQTSSKEQTKKLKDNTIWDF